MGTLLLFLTLAIVISFVCSVLEAVILSTSPVYASLLAKSHPRTGRALLVLRRDIDRPLSAILSLNTVAHTVGAAEVGARAQEAFGSVPVSVISAILTFLILVFSEIIPKTIGATYWRGLLVPSTWVMVGVVYLMYPLTILSRWITAVVAPGRSGTPYTREEFSEQIELGIREGIFREQESEIFRNLIRFRTLKARDIMTPRIVLISAPLTATVRQALSRDPLPVSRVLVHQEGASERIAGYVLKSDLLVAAATGREDAALEAFKRRILTLPDALNLESLLGRLISEQEHIAVLIDEYGGLAGIATMEDIVETLLGTEIVDEQDSIADTQAYARKRWARRARQLGIIDNLHDPDADIIPARQQPPPPPSSPS